MSLTALNIPVTASQAVYTTTPAAAAFAPVATPPTTPEI
jgi:hypothetical protein